MDCVTKNILAGCIAVAIIGGSFGHGCWILKELQYYDLAILVACCGGICIYAVAIYATKQLDTVIEDAVH